MNFKEFIKSANKDIEVACRIELERDNNELAKHIYQAVFPFYDDKSYSGDVVFTWKSPSLVKHGDYKGSRKSKIENNHYIGNIFPNYLTDRKYSLNLNRNGMMGDFPHDYIDVFLLHVAKYAYDDKSDFVEKHIKEYYPLKRAIQEERNLEHFKKFSSFKDYLQKHYFCEIWNQMQKKCFSDMEFDEFKLIAEDLIYTRGKVMIQSIVKNRKG